MSGGCRDGNMRLNTMVIVRSQKGGSGEQNVIRTEK